MEKTELLYHYTSYWTLCKILGSMQDDNNIFLRATNALRMNDPNDCFYFLDAVGKKVGATKDEIDRMFNIKIKYNPPYLISFSAKGDDLHMWTCYGDDGKGVALGFDKEGLERAVSKFSNSNPWIKAYLNRCKYQDTEQLYEDFHRPTKKELLLEDWWKVEYENDGKKYTKNVQGDVSDMSNIVKHPCYSYEQESRVVIIGKKDGTDSNFGYKELEDVYEVPIPLSCLKTITIGPSADFGYIKKSFSSGPIEENIFKQSQIPYRSKK